MNLLRKVVRNKEKEKIEEIKKIYGKKPKAKCPICKRKSLFITNDKGELFCIRCDSKIIKK